MKYAIVLLVCAGSLSAWACGGQEKPPLSADDLVDDAGIEQPMTTTTATATSMPAPTGSVPASPTPTKK